MKTMSSSPLSYSHCLFHCTAIALIIIISFFHRKTHANGTLSFPPFSGQYFRADVHENIYRCKASNQAGTILSRDVHITAGTTYIYNLKYLVKFSKTIFKTSNKDYQC